MYNNIYNIKATGSAALSLSLDATESCLIHDVRVHLNAVGASGTLSISIDSIDGSAYDVVLYTQDMTSVTDLVWIPTQQLSIVKGDKIIVAWANAGTKTYGVQLTYSI